MSISLKVINILAITGLIFCLIVLCACWDSISTIKMLFCFVMMFWFFYFLMTNLKKINHLRNSPIFGRVKTFQSQKRNSQLYERFRKIINNAYNNNSWSFIQSQYRQSWNRGLHYNSQQTYRTQTNKIIYHEQNQGFSSEKISKNQIPNSEITFFLPQSINGVTEQIRKKVISRNFLQRFQKQLYLLRDKNEIFYNSLSKRYFNQRTNLQSIQLNQSNELLLSKQHEIVIRDPINCLELISQSIEMKLEDCIKEFNHLLRVLAEIVIKCFDKNVNFQFNQQEDFNEKTVSISQLKSFITKFKNQGFLPQKLKPILPIREFATLYFSKLSLATDQALKILELTRNSQLATFKLYIYILKKMFPKESIQIEEHHSEFENKFKALRNTFFVHIVGSYISFTYNRIKGFVTQNPLVAVLGFLAECKRSGVSCEDQLFNESNKYIKLKTKST